MGVVGDIGIQDSEFRAISFRGGEPHGKEEARLTWAV